MARSTLNALQEHQHPANIHTSMDLSEENAAFLRALTQKEDAALHLTQELAAWFGERHGSHPVRYELD